MTGWRVGFAIGGAPLIAALGQVKANTDSGIFTAIQFAARTALDQYDILTPADPCPLQGTARRVRRGPGSRSAGTCRPLEATFYVWIPCPEGLHLDGALRPNPRRGRRRDHPRPRLRPDRRRLHPGRLDRRHPQAPPGGRTNWPVEALRRFPSGRPRNPVCGGPSVTNLSRARRAPSTGRLDLRSLASRIENGFVLS